MNERSTADQPSHTPPPDRSEVGLSEGDVAEALRDIADVPAVEVVTTVALHLMSAAAVKCGLSDEEADLAEARILINSLAALVVGSAADLGSFHAGPLRDGLTSLQRAFREASHPPDPVGQGPGEKFTGPVIASRSPHHD